MAYVITSACRDEKAAECVEVCPVDAIHGDDVQYYIDPNTCIDRGACEPVCPAEAIYQEDMVPEEEQEYIEINANFFKCTGGAGADQRTRAFPGLIRCEPSATKFLFPLDGGGASDK